MIRLSPAARAQVANLASYYADRDRVEAIRNLRTALAQAGNRITAGRGRFFEAPRPYPALTRPGWRWLIEGAYWIAFAPAGDDFVICAVFHETANMPSRIHEQ